MQGVKATKKSNKIPTILNPFYLFSVDVATEFDCLACWDNFLRPRTESTEVCSTKLCVSSILSIIYDVPIGGKMCCWIETARSRKCENTMNFHQY